MNCNDCRNFLSDSLDGRLSLDLETQLKHHILNCTSCQNEKRTLADIWSLLHVLEPIEPSQDFKVRFWKRIHEEESIEDNPWHTLIYLWKRHIFVQPAIALASLVLVSLLGTAIGFKILSQGFQDRQSKSPIIRWTESSPHNLQSGGFSL